jgi:hypothetical protein
VEVVHERCAGIDVHKRTVVVCAIAPGHKEVRTYGTMTRELREMMAWLQDVGKRYERRWRLLPAPGKDPGRMVRPSGTGALGNT